MDFDKIAIADMQCRIFRMSQQKWHMRASECGAIYKKFKLFDYISEGYDSLHCNSYERILTDIEDILMVNGVKLAQ